MYTTKIFKVFVLIFHKSELFMSTFKFHPSMSSGLTRKLTSMLGCPVRLMISGSLNIPEQIKIFFLIFTEYFIFYPYNVVWLNPCDEENNIVIDYC